KADFPTGRNGKISVDAKITLKGFENHEQHQCAVLESQGTFSGSPGDDMGPIGNMKIDKGKATGKTWFDPELGAMVDSIADQSLRVKGELPGQGGANRAGFTSDISQKITVKLVESGKTKAQL